MHDPTKCLMGSPASSGYDSAEIDSDPASFPAGVACRLNSSGGASLSASDGAWLGISLGKSLSNHKRLSVLRNGLKVPVLVEGGPARGVVTITSYANLVATSNDTLQIGATTFTFKASASTESEVGAVTNNNTTAANLASKINAHSVAGLLFKAVAVGAVVTITAKDNTTAGSSVALVYTDVHGSDIGLTVDAATFTGGAVASDFIVLGAKVYFSDTTGKADDPASASTISDAVYASGLLTGIDESGNSVAAVLVDMQGGL
jgi:hypothetical protein